MKKYLKYSGIVALVFALVAFILLMAAHSVVYADNTPSASSGSPQKNKTGIFL